MRSSLIPFVNNRILVVDDEEDVVHLVGSNLSTAGFHVFKAEDGAAAISLARRETPALIVLDIMLPGMSGMDVTRLLKRDPATAPISIMLLSARTEEVDRILGFELGVDDFMAKPFSPRELVLRVKAILSRKNVPPAESNVFRSGPIVVDQDRHAMTLDGTEVDLTAMEFKLLVTLMKIPGRVLSRDELLSRIWGSESGVGARTVDTHVRRLREKLGSSGDQIQTIRGVGYRLDEA
ncbi:MAG: response regulator transcription factor [Chthoniobacteraceae bacterium]